MVLFTRNAKKIKGAAYKNGNIDGTCKRALKLTCKVALASMILYNFTMLNRTKDQIKDWVAGVAPDVNLRNPLHVGEDAHMCGDPPWL